MGFTPMIFSCTHDVRPISVAVALLALFGVHAANADASENIPDVTLTGKCPVTCLSGFCDDVTGSCIIDWGSGVDDPPLVTRIGCPRGFYGSDCTEVCSVNCVNSTCSQVTGECTEGCETGYAGDDCTQDCPFGFYGDECQERCAKNCQNGTCDSRSGVCSDGCVEGFWGSDCSLGVEMSRNTPDERRSFYKHLSAEGKSVLLYVLSSRYEHALARVQFEIKRAIQDRNDISQLLDG
ncbi:multiple epidermal growth factor-like domains protein 10 isoform X2 [Littorina saxatilis]|uniref:EGF-like domain-containing protein n=1 Tax=Littorina saxatilis TaxID=31220 RepID=A0AAN9AYN6_9CAEN